MHISESIISGYRSDEWHKLAHLNSNNPASTGLPDTLFSGSHDYFPQLGDNSGSVVGMLAFTSSFPHLNDSFEWIAVRHQSGGLICNQLDLVGIVLGLCEGMVKAFRALARNHFGDAGGRFNKDSLWASDIASYVDALKAVGLNCERSFRLFEEGVYPVDATQAHMDLVFQNAPSRSDLTDGRDYGNLTILILAENSD